MSIDHPVVPVSGATVLLADVIDAAASGSQRVVLAPHPSGAALAARWFAPGHPTPIHENNGWGLALVVAGTDRYEQWALADDGTVALVEARQLNVGDCGWWGDPPHDIDRQETLADGALELIVVGAEPARALTEYRPSEYADSHEVAHP